MALMLDDLETFRKHRNEISESLISKFVGREKEIDDICALLSRHNLVVLTGNAGIGKSRLAIAAIEKYVCVNKEVSVLCVKSFGDYISAIEESIEDNKNYLLLIDDASDFKRLAEVIECLKYHNKNVKAIFTVRDYLKDCFNEEDLIIYEIHSLEKEEIKKAIALNTPIKNKEWLDKIASISKGNIRLAYVIANVVLKEEKGFDSLFNVNDIMNSFYKEQINKMSNSNNLIIIAGIISFFKSVNLNQLFYISPVLKIAGISKQEFLQSVDSLISMELVDECIGVVKVSDQCFADYLLNYVFIEKKYLKIKDVIVSTYKYYKKRIVESLNSILNTYLSDDAISYLKEEVLKVCALIEDVELKHEIEVTFAPIFLDYAVLEFKNGIEEYNDKKDIKWLLKLFAILSKTKYQSVAIEGVILLLKKTNLKKEELFKIINVTFMLDSNSIKSSFEYFNSFVTYLIEHNIKDEHFYLLISSHLKYSFSNSKLSIDNKLEYYSFNLNNNMNGIISFRKKCWDYVFSYELDNVLRIIIDFAKYHISKEADKIVKSDLKEINEYLENKECKELIQAVLYEEFKEEAKIYDFEDMLFSSTKYSEIISLILERKIGDQTYDEFKKIHEDNVHSVYVAYKSNIFEIINSINLISQYYNQNIQKFLLAILPFLDEFYETTLNMFVQYKVLPSTVVEKASAIIGIDTFYALIKSISNTAMKEEYLYAFYTLISRLCNKDTFEFEEWIKSKKNLEMNPIFARDVLSLRKVAENSGLSYLKLIKLIFKKREQNETLVKEYFSCIFYKNDAFKELLELDRDLAIEIYEFLIKQNENDYKNRALREIIYVKRNYIKIVAKNYLEVGIRDEEGLEEIIFNNDNCNLFFDTCIEIGKTKLPNFVPFSLQQFVSQNIDNQMMLDWIHAYIDKKHNDDVAMESLFTIIGNIDENYRNRFLIKYYEKGKDEEVLKCALLSHCESYSQEFAESYYNGKILSLEALKTALIKWDSLNLIYFINQLIEEYKAQIKENKISQLIEYVDSSLLNKLQEIDAKTEVSLADAFKLYVDDENFRKLLSSGYVAYKEGCFVSNTNVPIKFKDVLVNKSIIGIKTIQTNESEKKKYERYLSSMKIIHNRFNNEFQPTLDECLIQLFNEREWTTADFERETYLSKDIFSKIKNNDRNNLKKVTLIKILIGLKLQKPEIDFLLELNNTQLSKYDETDVLYSFILDSKIDIGMADELLREFGKEVF